MWKVVRSTMCQTRSVHASAHVPPVEVVKSLPRHSQQQLPRVLAEVQVLLELNQQQPSLQPTDWKRLLEVDTLYERQQILSEATEQKKKDMDKSQSDLLPHLIRGADFRNLQDKAFGARLCSKVVLDGELPQIRLDCSYLYSLPPSVLAHAISDVQKAVVHNWAHARPLPIHLNNYTPDVRVTRLAKKHWHFLYGPPNGTHDFKPHPLGPTVSSKGVEETLPSDVQPDQVVVIDAYAKKDVTLSALRNAKVVVVSACSEDKVPLNLRTTSTLPKFRFPLEKHVVWKRGTKAQKPSVYIAIIRDLLEENLSFATAFQRNLPSKHLTDGRITEDQADQLERQLRLEILEDASHSLKMFRTEAQLSQRKPQSQTPRVRVHKYSREERNRRRALEAQQSSRCD